MDYVISDTHFGHKSIIPYCNRPYENVELMNLEMIDEWNSVVDPKKDTVYHHGDFAWTKQAAMRILPKLNFKKLVLLIGNHDVKIRRWWEEQENVIVKDTHMFRKNKKKIFMHHYCQLVWPDSHRGSYHFHGHSHGNLNNPPPRAYDVGVDVIGFKPVTVEHVIDLIESR